MTVPDPDEVRRLFVRDLVATGMTDSAAEDYIAWAEHRGIQLREDREREEAMPESIPMPDERAVADALVSIVCRCGPPRHVRGYPECATARAAARAALVEMGEHRFVEPTS